MATRVTISGRLANFGLDDLTPFFPRISFIAEAPAVAGEHLLSTRRIEVIPDEFGIWSVQLVPSAQTTPATTYTIRVDWLIDTSNGVRDGLDVLLNVVIPNADSDIGDLPSKPSEKFWVGKTPPDNPQPGLWWLDTSAYPYVWKEWV